MENPKIDNKEIKLVGIQEIIKHKPNQNLTEELESLWKRVTKQKLKITSISDENLAVGYWHWIDNERRLFFAGILVKTLDDFKRDSNTGLCSWDLGKTQVAIFKEKNGEEGAIISSPAVFKKLNEMSFRLNTKFNGEIFVYPLAWLEGEIPQDDFHEIWIPIIKK